MEEIEERYNGINHIIESIHHKDLFLSYLTHFTWKEFRHLHENIAINFIHHIFIESLIIDFSKLCKKNESYSFQKLINICKAKDIKLNYDTIDTELNKLYKFFEENQIPDIRDQHIAHQDINAPVLKATSSTIKILILDINYLFELITTELGKEQKPFIDMNESLSEIFDEIRRIDEIKGQCEFAKFKGHNQIDISIIEELLIKKYR